MNLFLYWPPWSGKSTLWEALSKRLWLPHIDTDTIINSGSKKISKLIAISENYFRDKESEALAEIVRDKAISDIIKSVKTPWSIVSLWGGTLLREENEWLISLVSGRIIVLIPEDEDVLFERICKDTKNIRPLAQNQDAFKTLMNRRRAHYRSFGLQIIIDKKSTEQLVDEILQITST